VGMFKEVTETVSIDRDAESVASELERRLESLLSKSQEQTNENVESEDSAEDAIH